MYNQTLDFGLVEQTGALRDMVRRFAQKEISPRAGTTDRDNDSPRDLWQRVGSLGLLGTTADPDFGGSAMGYVARVIAIEEINRAASSVGLPLRRAPQSLHQSDELLARERGRRNRHVRDRFRL